MTHKAHDSRDILHNPLKDVDVCAIETAIGAALGKLINQKLTVDVTTLDFPAASHRTARLALTVSVPVDFRLLRGSRAAGNKEPPAAVEEPG